MSNKRKPNANKWINDYSNLDPDNQLYVAEEIAKELKDNETTFNEDEYEKEKSKIARRFFDSIINNAKQSEKLKNLLMFLKNMKSYLHVIEKKPSMKFLKLL